MQVTWTLPDGTQKTVDANEGQSMMEVAVENDIPDIIGECGGCLSCATCHVFVAPEWLERTGKADEFEDGMLDATEVERSDASRLSCQIKMHQGLDGLHLVVPTDT